MTEIRPAAAQLRLRLRAPLPGLGFCASAVIILQLQQAATGLIRHVLYFTGGVAIRAMESDSECRESNVQSNGVHRKVDIRTHLWTQDNRYPAA